jgi:hypothetical protein
VSQFPGFYNYITRILARSVLMKEVEEKVDEKYDSLQTNNVTI